MSLRSLTVPLALTAFAFPTIAQIGHTWGPELAPVGCPVYFSLYNGGTTDVMYDPCGFGVYDPAGNLVYRPLCPGPVLVQPGETHTSTWPQVDTTGAQVPPGRYHLNAPGGPVVTVGGADAAVAPLGTRDFELCAPLDAGFPYLMATTLSSTAPGFTACGQTIPLIPDAFLLSLNDPGTFQGFYGFLDSNGMASAQLNLPSGPSQLSQVDYAFVVFDFSQPCAVRRVSAVTRTLLF